MGTMAWDATAVPSALRAAWNVAALTAASALSSSFRQPLLLWTVADRYFAVGIHCHLDHDPALVPGLYFLCGIGGLGHVDDGQRAVQLRQRRR